MSYILSGLEMLFRTSGDVLHVLSMGTLLIKMRKTKSCSGISLKSQILYFIVYCLRYVDLVYLLVSPKTILERPRLVYNTFMKFLFIGIEGYTLHTMINKYYYSYDAEFDDTPLWILLVPAMCGGWYLASDPDSKKLMFLKLIINWFYGSSIVLECVSIVPQLVLLQKAGEGESLTVHYVVFLGLYRLMYIFGWVFRWLNGFPVSKALVWGSIVQTVLYSDFFFVYASSMLAKKKSFRIYPKKFIKEALGLQ
ncbi:ER lumen protein retaining receptor [Nematocida sp. AWRm77]|nr:ER lumen protein retaining receptor [Nematocida sp. AWRm77]